MASIQLTATFSPLNPEIALFPASDMRRLGNTGIQANLSRLASARNVFDQPAPKLSKRHAIRKAKAGKRQVRDLKFTGEMLAALGIRELDENHVQVSVNSPRQYEKGFYNQLIDPWFGLSPLDARAVDGTFESLLAERESRTFLPPRTVGGG